MKKDNRKRKKRETEPFDYECSPYVKSTIVLVLISDPFLISGTVALCNQWYPGAVLMFIIYSIFVAKIAKEIYRQDRIDYGNYSRIRHGFNLQEKENKKIYERLDEKMDKPVSTKNSNVRPGSRPSEEFKAMIGGEILDAGRKD